MGTFGPIWSTDLAGPPGWVDPSTLTRQVWDAQTARTIPGVGRALGIYGMVAACALQHVAMYPADPTRGEEQLGLPRFLQQPDPDMDLPTFIAVQLDDYLLHGNAAQLVTAYGADNYPAAARWFPAHRWGITADAQRQPEYRLDGQPIDRDRVVHVTRGRDPVCEWRGQGVVEQHLATLNRVALEEAAEASNLSARGMPGVAIIQPATSEFDQKVADEVAEKWEARFGTSQRHRPGVFPGGTQIVPLSWNPSDQQLVQARKMSLVDVANAFNLDGYWLGAPSSSHTYQSPGPNFLQLIRISLGPVMRTFEAVWSQQWLPYGRGVRFDRLELLRDDLKSMIQAFVAGRGAGLFPDINEPRVYMGFRPLAEDEKPKPPPQLDPSNHPGSEDHPAPDPADDGDPEEGAA